jgi:transposase
MLIIGGDYHPSFQEIAFVDTQTGKCGERRLTHREEAEQFYRDLKQRTGAVRVVMESRGHVRWFERMLRDLQFELWIGDAAEIRTKRVRKQKTDRQDGQLLLRLMMEDRFPRIRVPDAENRDLRQLLWHRHRVVQMRPRVMNQCGSFDSSSATMLPETRVAKTPWEEIAIKSGSTWGGVRFVEPEI